MPTSSSTGADMRANREAGLTLVEVLVVLAIIAVMTGVAVLGLGGGGRDASAQAEARRLAAAIQRAADEALLHGTPAAMSWDGKGYSFVHWQAEGRSWQAHEAPDLGDRRDLPEDVTLAGAGDAMVPIIGDAPLEFTVGEGPDSWRVRFDGLNATAVPSG